MKWEEVVSRVGCCPEVRQDDAERPLGLTSRGHGCPWGAAGRKQWVGRGWRLGRRGLRGEWEAVSGLERLGLNLGGRVV